MSFTDEDMKRLKEWATSYPFVVTNQDFDQIVALLERMEAAEKVCGVSLIMLNNWHNMGEGVWKALKNAWEKWHKACGRE